MENIFELLNGGFESAQARIDDLNKKFVKVEASHEAYISRAKSMQSHRLNPKPKRFQRVVEAEESEEEEEENIPVRMPSKELSQEPGDPELRPIRTAKTKANQNLKEVPGNVKMRNDNNTVVVKIERTSSINHSNNRESIKENKAPDASQKRRSPDEGIQSAPESQRTSKRSESVEIISAKVMEIDITEDDTGKMLPPTLPAKKAVKKARTKQKKPVEVVEEPAAAGLRITRSKIKQEKVSVGSSASLPTVQLELFKPVSSETTVTTVEGKKEKKKYPMPILVKLEPEEARKLSKQGSLDKQLKTNSRQPSVEEPPKAPSPLVQSAMVEETDQLNETYNVPATVTETVTIAPTMNETITIAPNPNSTVTITKNIHDSLMTEDNDEESVDNEVLENAPALFSKIPKQQPPPAMKLKKNEVFNPYLQSPVKQRVQAFEKHAIQGTPEKFSTLPAKFKSGTPLKVGLYGKTTPMSVNKNKFLTAGFSNPSLTASVPHGGKTKSLKKMNSLSHESLEESKKVQSSNVNALLEEKRKAREEKQRQAQLQREALEKEKRDLAIRQQQERDEKYRKTMKEKEDKQRMEALKKKMLKEKQAKKYAEEKTKKDEFVAPKPLEATPSFNKDDSLHLKLQKQLIKDKAQQQKKAESKNVYSFEMLHTDDSTDDESRPSAKRPSPPDWSKKLKRKTLIVMQSNIEPGVLDDLFSVQPISVDLREIFPAIDSRKLVRNSSAIWRTPPKHY